MITCNDIYVCNKCHKIIYFRSGTDYEALCPDCGPTLRLHQKNGLIGSPEELKKFEAGEQVEVQCPYCLSDNTAVKHKLFQIVKPKRAQWHCNRCGATF